MESNKTSHAPTPSGGGMPTTAAVKNRLVISKWESWALVISPKPHWLLLTASVYCHYVPYLALLIDESPSSVWDLTCTENEQNTSFHLQKLLLYCIAFETDMTGNVMFLILVSHHLFRTGHNARLESRTCVFLPYTMKLPRRRGISSGPINNN